MKPEMLLVVIAGLLAGANFKDDADAKKALDALQGDWVMVSSERNGEAVPADQVKLFRRTIKGNEFSVQRDGEIVVKGTIKIDASKTPKTIDITFTEGDNKDAVLLGIYELDGDNQKICYAAPGDKERPKEFTSKGDKGVTLSVWKKDKK